MSEPDEIDDYIGYLVDVGALEWTGMDDEGEPMYHPNMDIMKEVCRPYYDLLMDEVTEGLQELFQAGLVDFKLNDEMDPVWHLTDAGIELAEEVQKHMGLTDN